MSNDRLLEQAIRSGMNHQPAPQTQNVTLPLDGMSRLVECGVLTAEQVFNLIFRNQPPTEFRGKKEDS